MLQDRFGSADDFGSFSQDGRSVHLLQNDVNSGSPAKGRNRVIEEARGEYVTFIDDDDMLVPDAVSTLVKAAQETGAGAVVSRIQIVDGEGKPTEPSSAKGGPVKVYDAIETVKEQITRSGRPVPKSVGSMMMPHGDLYKIETLRPYLPIFPLDNSYFNGDDAAAFPRRFHHAGTIAAVDKALYHYRTSIGGIWETAGSDGRQNYSYAALEVQIADYMAQYWRDLDYDPSLKTALSNYLLLLVSDKAKKDPEIVKQCKKRYISKVPVLARSKRLKLQVWIYLTFPGPVKFAYKLLKRR
jgi:glycosyltransferase involved in cell wall biosynthesis